MFRRLAALAIAMTALTATPAAADPGDPQLEYTYRYPLQIESTSDPALLTTMVGDDLTTYFPFDSDCTALPPVGTRCELYVIPGWPVPGTTNPVEVVHRDRTSWTFRSLPGHAEGEDRYITFDFELDALTVRAWGPWTPTASITVTTGAAHALWARFASNVSRGF